MEPDHSGFFHGFKEHGANSVAGVPRLRANSAANPTDPKPRTERETSGNQRSAHQDSIARSKPPVQTSLQLQDAVDWLDVGLCKALIRGVCELGYVAPTPVQVKMIPAVMQGYDVCARAVTGSGKTAAFLLPLLHRLMTDATRITGGASSHVGTTGTTMGIKALILTPTRELALQCQESFEALSRFARNPPICSCTVGGVPMAAHVAELRRFPDAVVATPGRILDLLRNAPGITLETLHTFVLDEADKMLSCGYEEMVHQVLREVPKKRQSLLVSATMTRDVDKLARLALTRPLDIDIGPAAVSAQLHQEFIRVPEDGKRLKLAMIHHLCTEVYQNSKTLIFAKHLTTVRRIKIILQLLGLKVLTLHGELSMPERIAAVEQFSSGKASDEDLANENGSTNEPYQIMVATELAARGLDIPCIETVINYDMATTLTNYIHRVGRTARIGRCGRAVSLVLPIDEDIMSKVVRLTESPFGGVISKVLCRELDPEAVLRSQERVDAVFEDAREELLGDVMERNIRATESRVKRLDESSEGTLRPSRGASSAGSGPTWFETRQEKNHRAQEAKKAFKRAREDGTIEVGAADNESEEPPELERFTAGDLFTRKRKKGAHSKTPSQQWLEEKERKVKERKKGAFWEDTTGVLGGRKIPKRVSSPLDLKGHLPKGSFRRVRKTEERRQRRASSATTEKGKQQKGKRSGKHAGSQAKPRSGKPLRAGGGKSAGKKPSRSRQRNRR